MIVGLVILVYVLTGFTIASLVTKYEDDRNMNVGDFVFLGAIWPLIGGYFILSGPHKLLKMWIAFLKKDNK